MKDSKRPAWASGQCKCCRVGCIREVQKQQGTHHFFQSAPPSDSKRCCRLRARVALAFSTRALFFSSSFFSTFFFILALIALYTAFCLPEDSEEEDDEA